MDMHMMINGEKKCIFVKFIVYSSFVNIEEGGPALDEG